MAYEFIKLSKSLSKRVGGLNDEDLEVNDPEEGWGLCKDMLDCNIMDCED